MRRILPLLAAACIAVLATPAVACSLVGDYRVPTNLELVEQADLILIATVEDGPDMESGGFDEARLRIRPTALLKGDALPGPMTTFGFIADADYAVTSDPDELVQAHPLAYIGGCIRYMFVKGSSVLFFMKRRGEGYVPLGQPFSRWAEDVSSPDARWAKAVRLYVEVAALPDGERAAALIARRDALRARSGDPDAAAIADDIDRQLAGPNRSWNALMDEAVEEQALRSRR